MTERVRWRMTLDELCYETGVTANKLEEWAQLGAYGPRWKENRDRGKWRHITREVAQRAVIMSRLTRAGLREQVAASIAVTHKVGDLQPLEVRRDKLEFKVDRSTLP